MSNAQIRKMNKYLQTLLNGDLEHLASQYPEAGFSLDDRANLETFKVKLEYILNGE